MSIQAIHKLDYGLQTRINYTPSKNKLDTIRSSSGRPQRLAKRLPVCKMKKSTQGEKKGSWIREYVKRK